MTYSRNDKFQQFRKSPAHKEDKEKRLEESFDGEEEEERPTGVKADDSLGLDIVNVGKVKETLSGELPKEEGGGEGVRVGEGGDGLPILPFGIVFLLGALAALGALVYCCKIKKGGKSSKSSSPRSVDPPKKTFKRKASSPVVPSSPASHSDGGSKSKSSVSGSSKIGESALTSGLSSAALLSKSSVSESAGGKSEVRSGSSALSSAVHSQKNSSLVGGSSVTSSAVKGSKTGSSEVGEKSSFSSTSSGVSSTVGSKPSKK